VRLQPARDVKSSCLRPINPSMLLTVLALVIASGLLVARRLQERARRRAETDLRTIFETAPIGNLVLDDGDRLVEANAALARLVGREPQELLGRTLTELVYDGDVALLRVALAGLRHEVNARLETEIRFVHGTSGQPVMTSIHAAVLERADGRAHRTLIQVLDITERKRVEATLQHMADHDSLTGLLNRRSFEHELDQRVAHAKRYGAEGATLVLDVDHFKPVNDTYGHGAGDRLIVRVAEMLQQRLRGTDTLARLGGDEFAILLPKGDRNGAEAVARSLVETVRTQATLDEGECAEAITISIGVVMHDACADSTPAGIIAAADLAMYDAKTAGGNSFAFFTPAPTVRARKPVLVA
jgi:diguanylate cyclase (GGDEF)-like protein/PAS domain S-box-containing protein